jgi:hypothetical protein
MFVHPDRSGSNSLSVAAVQMVDGKPTITDAVQLIVSKCPACHRLVVLMNANDPETNQYKEIMAWPLGTKRPPVPPEVPQPIREDYLESARVLPFSAKASAALSRRCLQHVLIDAGKTKAGKLEKQIDEVLPNLPGDIGSNLDYARRIGNFGAHPEKSDITGMIVEVEPGEAEWNLDVLDGLFDHYYARPAREKKKREEFDKKLKQMGKQPISNP